MSTRVSGHALCAEGKPCKPRGPRGSYAYERIPGSVGRALCECGERSPVLESDGARKRWHREHKAAVSSDPLTPPERAAIDSLQRLAKRWPSALMLMSMDDGLHVVRTGDLRFSPENPTEGRQEAILATIYGIPSDGGAW